MSAPEIRVFNTMQQTKVPLSPITPGKLGIYVCGPTVYSFVHLGNARTFTSFDTIVRYLRFRGFEVRYVRNYTDVDDKIIKAAHDANEDPIALAARFIREFEADAQALHLLPPDVAPKVSETIPEIIAIIERLIDRGFAYASGGDVYFEVRRYPAYLKLSKKRLDDFVSGAGERELLLENKRDPLDFALWKAAKPGEPSWASPWGEGRPGWHIECSAMSAKYLGETFDLHGGGLDLIFPHHDNEIAQSEAASGKTLCNCWLHGGFLDLEGAKMSKSLGNVVRLRDALAQVDAEALRYFFLTTHYRQALSFSDKQLADAETRMEYFYETLKKVDERLEGKDFGPGPVHQDPGRFLRELDAAMADDFNFPGALGALAGLFNEMNQLTDKPPVKDKASVGRTLVALREVARQASRALGLFEDVPARWLSRRRDRQVTRYGIDPQQVEAAIAARHAARAEKTPEGFKAADQIRADLKAQRVEIMDTPQGTTWKVSAEPAS
ncbi:MAG: cysteine--tRNA ligase [Myxococcaceae bacterium]|nr:cysteine--tRNA ligase [Myxococcaceae bacterium]MCA3015768.1 cysteine--tRNA ligase [Myxococcaceae bacterium]